MTNIDWKYQPLFTINLGHSGTQEISLRVEPSNESLTLLSAAGLACRPIENGAIIYFEKRIFPDGSSKTINRIQKTIGFSFLIKSNNPQVFKQSNPQIWDNLPLTFSGKNQLLYLDNLGSGSVIDSNLSPLPPVPSMDYKMATMPLTTQEKVSTDDIASSFANTFDLTVSGTVVQIALESIKPNAPAPQIFPINADNRRIRLPLSTGGYYLDQTSSSTGSAKELILVGNDAYAPDVIGMLQIFKSAPVDYGLCVQYNVIF